MSRCSYMYSETLSNPTKPPPLRPCSRRFPQICPADKRARAADVTPEIVTVTEKSDLSGAKKIPISEHCDIKNRETNNFATVRTLELSYSSNIHLIFNENPKFHDLSSSSWLLSTRVAKSVRTGQTNSSEN